MEKLEKAIYELEEIKIPSMKRCLETFSDSKYFQGHLEAYVEILEDLKKLKNDM